jgi:peptidoglycan-N-acetylglucosamine deacetylase
MKDTFSHPNLNQTELNSYLDNIAKNELFLSQYFSKEIFSWFRFPFLGEGETTEKRMAVRQYLKDKGYKTAQVTIDFWDWAWNDTFARCFDKGDKFTIDWLRRSYLDLAEDRLYFSVEQARILFNRPIKHILLVHFGEFDALMMESLLGRYKQLGVRFIDFKTAMQDKVYENDPDILKFEGTFLSQHMQKSNIKFPPYLRVPMDMLEHACR